MKLNYPENLPISAYASKIINTVFENEVVIVTGETGSGKSTQLPKMLLEALAMEVQNAGSFTAQSGVKFGFKVACTQPRRIAATSIAMRIAEEVETPLGQEVGYKIRFDDNTSIGSVINICTDGILLQEIKSDFLLKDYAAVMVDEAHERNLNIDFLLGLLKEIQLKRVEAGLKRLKILITSATFDTKKFNEFFGGTVPVIAVEGRTFPVEVIYEPLKKGEFIYQKIAELVEKIEMSRREGDILIFMPGEQEIFQCIEEIQRLGFRNVNCLPLYSRLAIEDQQKIFHDHTGRNIIVATNIAETSITVPGAVFVIDSGLARLTDFDFKSGIGSLSVREVSKASCIQRTGRAGRVREGICYRLFSQENFEEREAFTKPEIQRSDLASVVLHMVSIGVKDVYEFDFIDPPERQAFSNAFQTLHELGALNKQNELTSLGRKMVHLPIEPRIAAMLLAAEKHDCVKEVAIIAAFLSAKDIFLRPREDEEAADAEKRFFQKLGNNSFAESKLVRIRRGRKVIMKRVKIAKSGGKFNSDLLTFLAVWKKCMAIESETDREIYCNGHFLNYQVLIEVKNIYDQLLNALETFAKKEFEGFLDEDVLKKDFDPVGVLKAVSTGLIQNLCELKGDRVYSSKSVDGISIHPGSFLFNMTPRWIVAAEIIETTRLYARNVSAVDISWFEEIAPHLCNFKFKRRFFDKKTGETFVEADVSFKGHRIEKDRVSTLAKIDPNAAFYDLIDHGLMERALAFAFPFIQKNLQILEKINSYAVRVEDKRKILTDDDLRDFYIRKLSNIGKMPVSKRDLSEVLSRKGFDYLNLDLNEHFSVNEQKQIDRLWPTEVAIGNLILNVKYGLQDYDGPVIFVKKQEYPLLQENFYEGVFHFNDQFKPWFIIVGADGRKRLAEGENLLEIEKKISKIKKI